MTNVKAGLKLAVFGLHALMTIIIQTPILWITRGSFSYHYPRFFHWGCTKIFGIKYEVIGQQARNAQTLYVCNHISYMDINVIGSIIRQASFIAKKDVRGMPLYGYLSTLQQTAYISRDKTDAIREKNALENMVAEGRDLILFPEGTTTIGTGVLPFKSSLFGIVLKDQVKDSLQVQPMTLSLVEVDGRLPTEKEIRDIYVWTTEMSDDLTEHLWRFAKTSGVKLRIEFHDPIPAKSVRDRKELAAAAWEKTKSALWLPDENDTTKLDSETKAA